MRIVVLVDGEHYPPGVRSAIGTLRAGGDDIVAAVYCGGSEKLRPGDLDAAYGVFVERGAPPPVLLAEAIDKHRPEAVVDLADEPVLDADARFRLSAVALARGVPYLGADFELRPAELRPVLQKPSVRVIATGKRTGKTAVAAALARHAVLRGRRPLIVAMGRGGPEHPQVVEVPPSASELLALANAGRHAASDYLEDAVTTGVPTIGCRRVGGGLAGRPFASNVVAGAVLAQERPEDLVILEGSGSSIPPVWAATGVMVVPAWASDQVKRYLQPYRVLLSDLVVVTMSEHFNPADACKAVRATSPTIEVVTTFFRPKPLGDLSGRRVFFCTTAPAGASGALVRHLSDVYGCRVVGISHALADRPALRQHLTEAPAHDVLLTEIKAAAIDVAVRFAVERGTEVVFSDNEPVGEGLDEAFDRVLSRA